MTISLVGKLVMIVLCLGVIGGMTALIVIYIQDINDNVTTTTSTSTTTAAPTTDPSVNDQFHVGVGIADMTGPCVEITFMGYAEVGQTGRGLHTRQYSRAFIFVRGDTRLVLVTADVQSVGIAVRRQVVENLQRLYGDTYSLRNVILTGTHTHSGPGGHLVHFLLDVSILGFSRETYNAYVDGITRSIVRAHDNVVPARLYFTRTQVPDAQYNRSPFSYNQNPAEERERYARNVDDELTQVRIEKTDGSLHGVMTWFGVHTTSMNMTNRLVSSDNLGYAAYRMEKHLNPGRIAGNPTVVAGFFISILGDISPNLRGARCEFSGNECDNQFLLCAALERCFAKGPGNDMFESTRIIGERVYLGALDALHKPGVELDGELAVIHQFVDMPQEAVPRYDPLLQNFNASDTVQGCVPAMGYSFASGTIDGANVLNITQGTIQGNPLLDAIAGVVAEPTPEDIECHAPKPILLATGRANFPLPWHPQIASISLIWLGGFAILGVPGEPTTMAGRRMKDVVGKVMEQRGLEPRVAVSSLTNEYIHYVCTFEEYQVQRYEAASTIYGPHTLDIFLSKFQEFTVAAIDGTNVPAGPEPNDYVNSTITLIVPVMLDTSAIGSSFGDVIEEPPEIVNRGDTVRAVFVGANPRNDLRQESSYLLVERLELGHWITVATDADWETRFLWEREPESNTASRVTIEWNVPSDAISAQHRVVYRGASRLVGGRLVQFEGVSRHFRIR
ncbi:neutral ceramidase-like [Bicyclus anynana]|uniref:Neutral ceramidase n=1 Tax=Bicyclus anynana TaxID=110368 RepID=A0A6J1NXQ0_BICAN|nr:neutral ceramidase-like [Bicyclus anynana]